MKLFYQLKLDAFVLPAIALLISLGGWALIADHGKTTVSVDDWGDRVTKTERFGLSKNLPSPAETWVASKPYVMEPFAKRGELDQGILRFAWLSLKLVAQGYANSYAHIILSILTIGFIGYILDRGMSLIEGRLRSA
jgi:nitrate/nitrite transport system permease protein